MHTCCSAAAVEQYAIGIATGTPNTADYEECTHLTTKASAARCTSMAAGLRLAGVCVLLVDLPAPRLPHPLLAARHRAVPRL